MRLYMYIWLSNLKVIKKTPTKYEIIAILQIYASRPDKARARGNPIYFGQNWGQILSTLIGAKFYYYVLYINRIDLKYRLLHINMQTKYNILPKTFYLRSNNHLQRFKYMVLYAATKKHVHTPNTLQLIHTAGLCLLRQARVHQRLTRTFNPLLHCRSYIFTVF